VEFIEPSEARKAFTRLAYTKFKHLPLYLEWAPDDSFISPVAKSSQENNTTDKLSQSKGMKSSEAANAKSMANTITDESKQNKTENNGQDEDDDEDEDEPEPDTTLFVKNISFNTTEEQLKKVKFRQLSKNVSVIRLTFYMSFVTVFFKMWSIALCNY
jgi:multiple RNA-binding domain-containing protein 1